MPKPDEKKLTIRLPRDLWREFKVAAIKNDESAQQIFEKCARDFVEAYASKQRE